MPIYEYKCKDCGEHFELITFVVKAQDDLECSKCKGKNVEKLISAPNVSVSSAAPDHKGSCCGSTQRPAPSCSGFGSCCGH
ncbi:MAG: zinc ribbon domain-containing protein [Candidatus Magnetoovum sp. WYHC-5]|nr:zinc ribbon domain-containing protein [Candidatus Magnetoovum sp. WYHC-5]